MRPGLQGPFSVHMTKVRTCRGAKHTNCDGVNYTATMISPAALYVDIHFEREIPPLEVKVSHLLNYFFLSMIDDLIKRK